VDDDGDDVVVQLSPGIEGAIGPEGRPLLRRWDHPDVDGGDDLPTRADDGALDIVESADRWLTLEDGIVIRFDPSRARDGHRYRTGDYWTFPARAATGDVAWPRDERTRARLAVRPHGVDHHLAPLAVAALDANGELTGAPLDCRPFFRHAAALP
jgi:hypothetical protein